MAIELYKATEANIADIQFIASTTWPNTYAEILTARQMSYMLNLMYNTNLLQALINSPNHIFKVLSVDDIVAGFYQLSVDEIEITNQKLNKIYILPNYAGKQLGKLMLEDIEQTCLLLNVQTIQLQVNRANKALGFYKKQGFEILLEADFDIGAGFFMNDYIMQKKLT